MSIFSQKEPMGQRGRPLSPKETSIIFFPSAFSTYWFRILNSHFVDGFGVFWIQMVLFEG